MSDLFDLKLIERQGNIETYTANMRIVMKKFVTRDVNEALLFKMKLLENKASRRIYDIREDKNILYILIHPKENIDDLLKGKIIKEAVTKGHCDPIKKKELSNLFQYEESICKIKYLKMINNELRYVYGTGFFLLLNIRDIPFSKCLITNNHVLNENFFRTNREIEMEYNNQMKAIQIGKRRFYTNKILDYTCIEIYDNDNIKRFFMINQPILMGNLNMFINKDIFILQFPQGEDISFSEGKILSIRDVHCFTNNCSTLKGSSGSPVILREDSTVIGLHHSSFYLEENNKINSYNLSTSIFSIIKDILKLGRNNQNNQIILKQNNFINYNYDNKNNNINNQNQGINYLIAEFSVDDQGIYQNIKIINSYEQYKRENPKVIFDKNRENEKELMQNCKIEINGKLIPFSYYYQFKDKKARIKYIFTNNIRQMNFLFCGIKYLESINLSNFNAKNVANMDYMFYGCSSLISINLSNFNAPDLATMGNILSECKSLKTIDLSNFIAPKITNMEKMFYNYSSLQSINLSNLNIPNINNMAYMFSGCVSLISINLTNFKTDNVSNMAFMFSGCESLISINLSSFKTQNVKNMAYMFSDCKSLKSIDLSGFNTQKVTDMKYMFSSCESLETFDFPNFDTQNVTDISYMFSGCKSLNSINLSKFNTQNVTNMEYMFSGCESLNIIDLSNFITKNVNKISYIFSGCNSLISINLSNLDTQKVSSLSHLFSDCKSLKSVNLSNWRMNKDSYITDIFSGCNSLKTINLSKSNFFSYFKIDKRQKIKGKREKLPTYSDPFPDYYRMFDYEYIDYSNMEDIFNDLNSLISIDLSYCDTQKITSLCEIFSNLKNLESIDLSSLKAPNITDMSRMFSGCNSLISINLSNLNAPNTTNMSRMFYSCKSLISINLSNLNAPNINNMSGMFYSCQSLKSIDLSNLNTQNVTNMEEMFSNCESLITINLSNFNTRKVTNMSYMFSECKSIKSIDLSNFNTENVKNMKCMFSNCSSLIRLNISNFHISKKTEYKDIFKGCLLLKPENVIIQDKKLKNEIDHCVIY